MVKSLEFYRKQFEMTIRKQKSPSADASRGFCLTQEIFLLKYVTKLDLERIRGRK